MGLLRVAKTGEHVKVTKCWLGPAAGPRLAHVLKLSMGLCGQWVRLRTEHVSLLHPQQSRSWDLSHPKLQQLGPLHLRFIFKQVNYIQDLALHSSKRQGHE